MSITFIVYFYVFFSRFHKNPTPLKGNPRKVSPQAAHANPWVLAALFCSTKKHPLLGVFLVYPLGFSDTLKREPSESSGNQRLPHANPLGSHLFQPIQKAPRKGVLWCTRWGSNPNSTASEAVMLSSYTTSTYSFFKKHIYFTIFRFLFASVYGIIFSNSAKIFPEKFTWERFICRKRS